MGSTPICIAPLRLSRLPERMVKAAITSQSDFEALLRNIDHELANVDRHAGLVDAERNTTSSLGGNSADM